MSVVRLIGQTPDMTAVEVNIGNTYRTITIITHATDVVVGWINDVYNTYVPPAHDNSSIYVALHVELSPPNNTIAVLQFRIDNWCLIYQLRHRNETSPLVRLNDFLNDDRFCFSGVAMELAILQLWIEYGLRVRSAIDLRNVASRRLQRLDLQSAGLDQLLGEVMGIVITRPDAAQRSALLERVPPLELIPFACADVIFSYELGGVLLG